MAHLLQGQRTPCSLQADIKSETGLRLVSSLRLGLWSPSDRCDLVNVRFVSKDLREHSQALTVLATSEMLQVTHRVTHTMSHSADYSRHRNFQTRFNF